MKDSPAYYEHNHFTLMDSIYSTATEDTNTCRGNESSEKVWWEKYLINCYINISHFYPGARGDQRNRLGVHGS